MALDLKSMTAIAVGIISILVVLWRKADISLEPREPPIALSKIPFIGHILGMIRYQIKYFEMLSHNDHPLFTIKIFNTRIYVIKSPEYVALAFRETKTLRFDVFTTEFLKNGLDGDQSLVDIFENTTYLADIHTHTYSVLSIGPDLTESNARVLNVVSRYLAPQETNLYAFLRETYTIAAGEALYGPENPVPELIDEIWDFEENVGLMMIGFSTRLTARKAYRAQKLYSKAFKAYYDAGLEKNGNTLVSGRAQIARNFNMDNTALGIFEMAISFAAVTNIVPTVFWMLSYIYTNPELLEDLREEVVVLGNPLDINKFRSCPLLVSTFQETMRLTQHGNAVRLVTADTQLGDYLLKKGSIVQIPGAVLNKATSTWGPDSTEFNPRRFLDIGDKKSRQYGFSPFGGGKHLCPGRHLALTEALGFVAALVSGFDMEGAKVIGTRTHKMGSGTKKPAGDVKVSITPRKGYENTKWSFNVGIERESKQSQV